MAVEGDAGNKTMESHVRTYGRMISMFKVGTVAAVLVAALVIWLIAG